MIASSHRVLLVEDVPMIAAITAQMLKKSTGRQYRSVHTTRLDETLARLKQEDFDVILLDLNLPDSSDLDTVRHVIAAAPEVPVIVLTASNGDGIGVQAVQQGAQDFLIKGEFNHLALDRAILYAMERHRLQRTIRQMAVLDELTGLYNRRGFNALSADVLQRVRQSESRGFLCFFDLDRFKQINDELGHAKGDEALAEFAAILRSVFRKAALLVRLGGDEFVAMGMESHPGQVEEALGLLEVALAARNSAGAGFTLESSAGLAWFDRNGPSTLEAITAAADAALYQHKEFRRSARAAAPALEPQEARP
jgi:two-component system cell cycle response regulator